MTRAWRADEKEKIKRGLLRIFPLTLLIAVACLFLFSWIAEEMLEQETRRFDSYVRDAIHRFASPHLTSFMIAMTDIGTWMGLVPIGIIVLWILLARRKRRAAVLFVVTVVGGLVLDAALKVAFHRPRPTPFFGFPVPSSYSFPSGHALVSFCFFGVLAWIATSHLALRWQRAFVWITAVVLIALIGASRIYLGVHYPSDVAAGYLAAAVWVSAIELVGKRWRVGQQAEGLSHQP